MLGLTIISIITILTLISAIIYFPEIHIKKIKIESFWVVSLIGAAFLIALKYLNINEVFIGITNNSAINPIKIIIIFISMTIMSIILDELGFFHKLASIALSKSKGTQVKIFLYLYFTVSLLTIFTSNDIIILTFTPFICYFTKNAKINPLPYLISEFVAANTWSMMLVIGNPTNIYLASSYNIDFIHYFKVMFLPTTISALFSFALLFFIFRKELKKKIEVDKIDIVLKDKNLVYITLIHLVLCTIILTIASYLHFEMYYICLFFATSNLLIIYIYQRLIKKKKSFIFLNSLKRAPWSLVPFVLSMFVFVLALNKYELSKQIYSFLINYNPIYSFGLSSLLSANIINNIPMTILFSNVITNIPTVNHVILNKSIFASIIGSNIGAYLTPIGALAGIMWMRILKKEDVSLTFLKFINYGIILSIPTIIISLIILSLVL